MNLALLKPHDYGSVPHCERCNRPVDSVEWRRYFDHVEGYYGTEIIPNGCGYVEVKCHGETWRAQFYPWGFGPGEVR